MTDPNTVQSDITYMRQLAESGRKGPIIGGTFLAAAGLVYGGMCFLQWFISTGQLPIPVAWSGTLWTGASVFFAILWLGLFLRMRRTAAKYTGASNNIFGLTWTGCALGIFTTIFSIAIVADISGHPEIQNLYAPATMAFYGVAWFIAGALGHRRWMYVASAASFASTLGVAALTGDLRQLLAFGTALLLTLSVPGFKLMIDARQ
jgi:hypothetical protein